MEEDVLNDTQPAGWYAANDGRMRWWDGKAWGPTAPSPTMGTQGKSGTGARVAIILTVAVAVALLLWVIIPFDLG